MIQEQELGNKYGGDFSTEESANEKIVREKET